MNRSTYLGIVLAVAALLSGGIFVVGRASKQNLSSAARLSELEARLVASEERLGSAESQLSLQRLGLLSPGAGRDVNPLDGNGSRGEGRAPTEVGGSAEAVPEFTVADDERLEKSMLEALEALHRSDVRDAQGTRETEAKAREVLVEQAFADTSLVNVSCGQSVCRFEATHANQKARSAFRALMPLRLMSILPQASIFERGTDGTVGFFARQGHSLPEPDPELLRGTGS